MARGEGRGEKGKREKGKKGRREEETIIPALIPLVKSDFSQSIISMSSDQWEIRQIIDICNEVAKMHGVYPEAEDPTLGQRLLVGPLGRVEVVLLDSFGEPELDLGLSLLVSLLTLTSNRELRTDSTASEPWPRHVRCMASEVRPFHSQTFRPVWVQKSPRMVPGKLFDGSVSPNN